MDIPQAQRVSVNIAIASGHGGGECKNAKDGNRVPNKNEDSNNEANGPLL